MNTSFRNINRSYKRSLCCWDFWDHLYSSHSELSEAASGIVLQVSWKTVKALISFKMVFPKLPVICRYDTGSKSKENFWKLQKSSRTIAHKHKIVLLQYWGESLGIYQHLCKKGENWTSGGQKKSDSTPTPEATNYLCLIYGSLKPQQGFHPLRCWWHDTMSLVGKPRPSNCEIDNICSEIWNGYIRNLITKRALKMIWKSQIVPKSSSKGSCWFLWILKDLKSTASSQQCFWSLTF